MSLGRYDSFGWLSLDGRKLHTGGFLISIEIGSKSMLSRCRCQLVCIYMNVHMTSYRDILALIIYCLPLHPGTFEQVISWGGDLQSQGWPPWFWCYKDFIARAFWGTIVFISCRFSASLDGGSMRVPFLWKSFYVWQCGRTLFPTCCILQTGFCPLQSLGTST